MADRSPTTVPRRRGSRAATSCVLVVDDEPVIRRLTRQMLEHAGFSILEADSGAAALELAERRWKRLDLVLTDVRMPGMSGWELAATLRARHPTVPVMLMSGFGPQPQGNAVPGLLLLRKPFTAEQLVRMVTTLIRPPAS